MNNNPKNKLTRTKSGHQIKQDAATTTVPDHQDPEAFWQDVYIFLSTQWISLNYIYLGPADLMSHLPDPLHRIRLLHLLPPHHSLLYVSLRH